MKIKLDEQKKILEFWYLNLVIKILKEEEIMSGYLNTQKRIHSEIEVECLKLYKTRIKVIQTS